MNIQFQWFILASIGFVILRELFMLSVMLVKLSWEVYQYKRGLRLMAELPNETVKWDSLWQSDCDLT